jgi:hypothetical protein
VRVSRGAVMKVYPGIDFAARVPADKKTEGEY